MGWAALCSAGDQLLFYADAAAGGDMLQVVAHSADDADDTYRSYQVRALVTAGFDTGDERQ